MKTCMYDNNTSWLRSAKKRITNDWQLYTLILPAIVAVFIFSYIPMPGVQIAMRDYKASQGIWNSNWVGLEYFEKFLNYPLFLEIIRNTIALSLYTLLTFPCPLIFALLLNELGNQRLKKTVQTLTYAPHFISVVILVSIVSLFFDRANGLVNNVIEMVGGERYAFMSEPAAFRHLYVWSGVWQNIGWNSIIYIAALSNVSAEMIEAARIDGASKAKIMWYINLPTILPTVITLLILNTGHILSVGFEKVYLMQNPLNKEVSRVISTYVYEIGLGNAQYSYSTAIGLFNNIVNILFITVVNAICKKVTEVSMW